MKEIHHWIDGKEVAGKSGRYSDIYNPATGELQARVALATADELNAAIDSAARAQVGKENDSPLK